MNPPRKSPSSRNNNQDKDTAPFTLDYDHLLRLCLKYWKWLAAGIAAGALIGYIVTLFQTPIYAAMATIEVPAKDTALTGADVGSADYTGSEIATYVQLLQTKELPAQVVKSLKLDQDSNFVPDAPISEDAAAGILKGEVNIRNRPLTRLIDITVEHPSPDMAEKLANQMAQEAITQQFVRANTVATTASDELQKDVDRLKQKVTDSQHALEQYQKDHNMQGTLEDPGAAVDARLKDLQQQLNAAEVQVSLLEERYGPQMPKLIQAKELADELRTEVDKAQADDLSSSTKNIEYSTLLTEAKSAKDQLESTLKESQIVQSAQVVSIPGLRVAEDAQAFGPVRPNKVKSIGTGAMAGLFCGACFIIGLYFVDTSIRTVAQAEGALSLPVIAAIPILTESDGRSILPTFSDPHSFVAESFRGLRASLILHDRDNPLKTILVGSAIPGEGKSFCAANLAVAFAQAGLRTLLIDADLRLPTLHTYFNIPAGEETTGFTDVLTGRSTLDSAVVASPIPTLSLLLTTEAAESPAELLSGIRLPLMLDEAAEKYDRVVIDSAPLNAVSDTMLILQKADAILLVVRAAQTPASESKSALQKIYSSKMKPLGLILNYLAAHTLKSYSYGYSYGQKPPKEKNAK
jgi:polysaccharide biosynthesis transport protein